MKKELILHKSDGVYAAEVYNSYPSFTVMLWKDGDPLRTWKCPTEQDARVEHALALRYPNVFARYGGSKEWPDDERVKAGLPVAEPAQQTEGGRNGT